MILHRGGDTIRPKIMKLYSSIVFESTSSTSSLGLIISTQSPDPPPALAAHPERWRSADTAARRSRRWHTRSPTAFGRAQEPGLLSC